jgi:hypothetical protein
MGFYRRRCLARPRRAATERAGVDGEVKSFSKLDVSAVFHASIPPRCRSAIRRPATTHTMMSFSSLRPCDVGVELELVKRTLSCMHSSWPAGRWPKKLNGLYSVRWTCMPTYSCGARSRSDGKPACPCEQRLGHISPPPYGV